MSAHKIGRCPLNTLISVAALAPEQAAGSCVLVTNSNGASCTGDDCVGLRPRLFHGGCASRVLLAEGQKLAFIA